MDKLEQLINKLKDAKEELNKAANLNNPYGDEPKGAKGENARNDKNDKEPELESPKNLKSKDQPSIKKEEMNEVCKLDKNGQWSLEKDAADPKLAPKDRKVKELQTKIDTGAYKPDAGKIADKMLKPLKKEEQPIKIKKPKLGPAPNNLHEWKSEDMADHIRAHDPSAHKLSLHEWKDSELRDHIHDMHKNDSPAEC
jgi:anti-sigma28 factor (negative regulator of flagellin synthesis)